MTRKLLAWGGLLVVLTGCQNSMFNLSSARSTFHDSADVQGVRLVLIETRNGSVDVQSEPGSATIEVSGTKHAQGATAQQARERVDRIQIRLERDAARPEVLRVVADFDGLIDGSPGASFRVVLPPDVELGIVTSNASITAAGTGHNVNAETSNGSISMEQITGNLHLKTSNASVTAVNVTGDVDAVSTNGSVRLENVGAGRVSVVTSNASITAVEPRGQVHLVSSNGTVNLKASTPLPHVTVRTSNAGANVKLPNTIAGTLRLKTSNASVHTNLNEARVSRTETDKSSFSAVLNGGGGMIDVQTSNGSIHFDLTESSKNLQQAEKPIP